jgi:hypothetical protein
MAYAVEGRSDCEQHCGNRQDDHDDRPFRQCVSSERLQLGRTESRRVRQLDRMGRQPTYRPTAAHSDSAGTDMKSPRRLGSGQAVGVDAGEQRDIRLLDQAQQTASLENPTCFQLDERR